MAHHLLRLLGGWYSAIWPNLAASGICSVIVYVRLHAHQARLHAAAQIAAHHRHEALLTHVSEVASKES